MLRILPLFFLLLCGCHGHMLVLHKQKVDARVFASTYVGSPEPRCPPQGEMIVAEWVLGSGYMKKCPELHLHVIFKDFSEKVIIYPVNKPFGYYTYQLVGETFCETGGILTYKGELVTKEGELIEKWAHQLWFKLIDIDLTNSES